MNAPPNARKTGPFHFGLAAGAFATAAVSAIHGLNTLATPIGIFDEAIQLVNARLVLDGQLPHRDFFSLYPPLNYYLNGAAFYLFGHSAITARLLSLTLSVLVAVFSYLRIARVTRISPAACFGSGLLLALASATVYTMQFWNALALAMLGTLAAARALDDDDYSGVWLTVAGALSAAVLLTRVNFGIYNIAALSIAILAASFCEESGPNRAGRLARRGIAAAGGFSLFMLVFWCLYGGSVIEVLRQTISDGASVIRLRTLPISPSPHSVACFFPAAYVLVSDYVNGALNRTRIIFSVAAVGLLLWTLLSPTLDPFTASKLAPLINLGLLAMSLVTKARLNAPEVISLVAYCGALHYYLSRADGFHATALLPSTAIVMVEFGVQAFREPVQAVVRRRRIDAIALLAIAAAPVLFSSGPLVPSVDGVRSGADLVSWYCSQHRPNDATELMDHSPPAAPLSKLYGWMPGISFIRKVRSVTGKDDFVYVGASNHENARWTPVLPYWLLDRAIPRGHHVIESGVTTSPAAQHKIALELEHRKVDWVILYPAEIETGDLGESGRSTILNDYIRTHFQQLQSEPRVTLWRRK